MSIQIDKNIEVPKSQTSKFPFEKMKVGDSFLACKEKNVNKQSSISTIARQWAVSKRYEWKFTVRQVEGGIRVWRTK